MQNRASLSVTSSGAAEITARFFDGLSDPTRLRIVMLLLERSHTVGEIVATLGLRQARGSKALVCLKGFRSVEARRGGRYAWSAGSDPCIPELGNLARAAMADH